MTIREDCFSSSAILIPPSEFDIKFYYSDSSGGFAENPNIPRLSSCVLTNTQIDYAPQGMFAAFEGDGAPVNIKLTLSFREVDLITRELVEAGF